MPRYQCCRGITVPVSEMICRSHSVSTAIKMFSRCYLISSGSCIPTFVSHIILHEDFDNPFESNAPVKCDHVEFN